MHAEQHIDREAGVFFQRVEFDFDGRRFGREQIAAAFDEQVGRRFGMTAQVRFGDERPRLAVLASREPHCLADLLARWRAGELPAEIVTVVSNHTDHAELAAFHGLPYHVLPVTPTTTVTQDAELVRLLSRYRVELVVLARYMQVLGPAVLAEYPARIINIHHSFLPAFVRCAPVPPGPATRRQGHRSDRALRDRRPRRGPDHRPGRRHR